MTNRQAQKEQTRKNIIDAAYRVYSLYGVKATTIMIAKEAGVSHGSLFAHFPAFTDLLIRILDDFGSTAGYRLHRAAEESRTIESLLEAHLDVLEEYEDFYTRLISEINLLPEEAGTTYVTLQSVVSFHFSKIAEAGIKNGEIKNIPLHIVFNTWTGLIHYYLQNRELFAPGESVLKRYRRELADSFLKLIRT